MTWMFCRSIKRLFDLNLRKQLKSSIKYVIFLFVFLCSFSGAFCAGTAIPIPEKAKHQTRAYFDGISPRVIKLIEDGSPRSLKIAASLLHRSVDDNYTEKERTLLLICRSIDEICWPSVKPDWKTPDVNFSNYYTNVLFSVNSGIYDSAICYDDCISYILPCLVLFKSSSIKSSTLAKMESSLAKALELRENSTLANYLMGVLLSKKGRDSDAVAYFEKALLSDGSNKEILGADVKALSAAGKYDKALELSEKLLTLDSMNINALELHCDTCYEQGDWAAAGEYAAKILMLDSTKTKYVLMRAEIALESGDYVKATTLLDAYSRNDKLSKKYYLLQARVQSEWNKNNAVAAATIGQALLLYPDDTEVLMMASKIASDGNMIVAGMSAQNYAQKVLDKDPLNMSALSVSIAELAKAEEYEKAYSLSCTAIKNSDSEELVYQHIDICLALGKTTEAGNLAKKLYSKNSSDADAQKSYLKVLVASGRKDEADSMISTLLKTADSATKSFLLYERSFLYSDESNIIASLRSSLTANPRNTDSLYRMYQVYYGKSDWKKAQYYLKQVVALNPSNTKALAMSKKLDSLIKGNL